MKNNSRTIILICFLFLMGNSVFGQLTIEHCQDKAKKNYPMIMQYDLIEKSTEYHIANANKAFLPQFKINAIGAYIIQGFPEVSFPGMPASEDSKMKFIGIGQFNQVIWDGGATRTQKNVINANAEVEKSKIEVSLYSIEERVNQLFFSVMLIDEQLNQLSIAKDNLYLNLNKLEISKEQGLIYETDVDELRAELLNMEQREIDFKFTRKGYLEMLSYIMGEALSPDVQLEKPITENFEMLLLQENNRPELKLFSSQMALIEQSSSFHKVANMPKVGILGAGMLFAPEANFGVSQIPSLALAGVSVTWNTSGLYKNSNNRQLDKLQLDRISSERETFLFTGNIQLKQLSAEIQKQKAILEKDVEIVNLKSKIRKNYQLKYDNGLSAMNDLITAINKETEARGNEAFHRVQLLMNMYKYKTVNGN